MVLLSMSILAECVLFSHAGLSLTSVLGRIHSTDLVKHLREPADQDLLQSVNDTFGQDCNKDLLQSVNDTFGQEMEFVSKPLVHAYSAVVPAEVIDDDLAPFQVFDDGYCEVNHPWTPGDHGCEYVKTAEDCTAAAMALGLQPAPVQTDSFLAAPSINANAAPSYRAPPSMSFVQPRGCLTGKQESTGAEGKVVVFAAGYGTARCGMDGLSCICNCKVRRQVSNGQDLDEPEPEHVALLAAGTVVFVTIVFICGHVSRRILSASWKLVAFSMI